MTEALAVRVPARSTVVPPGSLPAVARRVVKAGSVRSVPSSERVRADVEAAAVRLAELEEAAQAAWREGHAAGVAETLAAGHDAVLRAADALDTAVENVTGQREREVSATSAAVLSAALEVAEWVLRRELSADGQALLARLEAGLTALLPSPTTRIAVRPDAYDLVTEWTTGRGRVGTVVVADARLAPGDAVVTTDAGCAEVTVAAALRTAGEALGLPLGGHDDEEDAA